MLIEENTVSLSVLISNSYNIFSYNEWFVQRLQKQKTKDKTKKNPWWKGLKEQ